MIKSQSVERPPNRYPTLSVRTQRLAYVEQGTGQPLILIHGSASDLRTWRDQLPAFGQNFRTVAYSRRYHLPNDPIPPGSDYLLEEHVEDLGSVLHRFGPAPANLVGHSYGGLVALEAAARWPDLIDRLVLAEPPVVSLFVDPEPDPGKILGLLLRRPRLGFVILRFAQGGLEPARSALQRGDREAAFQAFAHATLGTAAFEALSHERLLQARGNFIEAELLKSGLPPLAPYSIRQVTCPTLLITGDHSPRLFRLLTDRLHELLPQAERITIERASHIVHEDNPAGFNRAVLQHLGGTPPGTGSSARDNRHQHQSKLKEVET
jgi:pimeloyl-ACP methyl ester carboxylesterase